VRRSVPVRSGTPAAGWPGRLERSPSRPSTLFVLGSAQQLAPEFTASGSRSTVPQELYITALGNSQPWRVGGAPAWRSWIGPSGFEHDQLAIEDKSLGRQRVKLAVICSCLRLIS
jgi:hypothetical protein